MPPRITTPTDSYVFVYPQAEEFFQAQKKMFWTDDEVQVEKDVHCILTELTEAERHGVITTLKLFTLYELIVGGEYWTGVVKKYFPRPEIQKMATYFGMIELCVHAPFYDRINKSLGLATDEFYTSYVDDPELKERVDFLDEIVAQTKDNLPLSLAVFSMIEGAILYSSFAFLKHFQSNGKDKLANIGAGINFSAQDEDLHAQAGAWIYRQYMEELNPTTQESLLVQGQIRNAATKLREHEYKIIDMIFAKGEIAGITKEQLRGFVDHRIATCLNNLGVEAQEDPETCQEIQKWFYAGAKGYVFHDFFSKMGREYERSWVKGNFNWGNV